MNPDQITPVVLTCNEAPNIGRCLERLRWAREVLVVDSFSTDETLNIVGEFPNTRVCQRTFDDFANQWHYALDHGEIQTPWILALDADYMVTDEFLAEVNDLAERPAISAYVAPFVFAIWGRPLRGSVYPPVAVLFRKNCCRYRQDGHAYRLVVERGETVSLSSPLVHDDRKSLGRWLQSQSKYMDLEAEKLLATPRGRLSGTDRLRRYTPLAPILVLLYSLVVKRGGFDGPAGWFYAWQRCAAEAILQLKLLERRLAGSTPQPATIQPTARQENVGSGGRVS
ncbi:MAG TPA: glycosyltransferase family 2 protein [Pirellulales bacterium]|jgi:glycosyltransferase involved in cell wall biosynthesis|nr:glycosyltransferase family 2 protein [Pirellulales bacterium]